MAKFLVTHTLDHHELADHIAKVGSLQNATLAILPDHEQATPASRNQPHIVPNQEVRTRKLRGSKVNTAVLTAMAAGPANITKMKESLVAAGLAASSLSTALATLQKNGEIERVGDGQYQLARGSLAAE